MASHRRRRPVGPSALSRAAATVVAAGAAVLAAQGAATAAPGGGAGSGGAPAGSAAPAAVSLDQVQQQVQSLYAQAESAGQSYDGAREQQRLLQRASAELQQHVAQEQQHVNDLMRTVGSLAAQQYAEAGSDPLMQLMLDSDPADYLSRATVEGQAASAAATDLDRARAAERQLALDRAQAVAQLHHLEQLRDTITGSKQAIQQRLGRAKALLGSLTGAQRAQINQQQAQQAQQDASLAQQAVDAVLNAPGDARAALALAAARSALGSPYVYGADGPFAFDCSGLMQWAWRHAGVALPRTSQEQALAGTPVPLSQARPGDLVIFFADRHHVGMYAGDGMVIHAPYPGARVRYEAIRDMPVAEVVRV